MKKAIATAIISAISLSMLVSCGSTSESSENDSVRPEKNTAASKTTSEATSLSAEKIRLPGEDQTQSSTKSSSKKNSKTSSDKNRNSEKVTFPSEIDLSDGNAAMDLEKKKRGIKPDDDGFIIDDGILYDYDGTDSEIHIPDDVTRIEARAFWGNDVVEAVYIPSSVEYIGDSAFWSCGALRYVEIEDGMKKISDRAFWSCSALKDVIIPESVTSIGASAFSECAFTSFVVPDTVKKFETSGAFSGCVLRRRISENRSAKGWRRKCSPIWSAASRAGNYPWKTSC